MRDLAKLRCRDSSCVLTAAPSAPDQNTQQQQATFKVTSDLDLMKWVKEKYRLNAKQTGEKNPSNELSLALNMSLKD